MAPRSRIGAMPGIARRRLLASLSALFALPFAARFGRAAPAPTVARFPELEEITGAATLRAGRVKLDVPRMAENVNAIALTVSVDSPMSASDYVKSIHLFAPRNPRRALAHFHLGPRAGRAEIGTRIRLAESQEVIAVAELSDGSFWSAAAPVEVTVSACYDGS